VTVKDKGSSQVRDSIKLRNTRPFAPQDRAAIVPKRSVFNRIIGANPFELDFAAFLDGCSDIVSFAKNFFAIGFKLDYVKADGSISTYTPDFLVKVTPAAVCVVETKGLEDVDVSPKMARLKQWCADLNASQSAVRYSFAYVEQEAFESYRPKNFAELVASFRTDQ
jgi:type III restriction enzyme